MESLCRSVQGKTLPKRSIIRDNLAASPGQMWRKVEEMEQSTSWRRLMEGESGAKSALYVSTHPTRLQVRRHLTWQWHWRPLAVCDSVSGVLWNNTVHQLCNCPLWTWQRDLSLATEKWCWKQDKPAEGRASIVLGFRTGKANLQVWRDCIVWHLMEVTLPQRCPKWQLLSIWNVSSVTEKLMFKFI